MKRLTGVLKLTAALLMALSLCACGSGEGKLTALELSPQPSPTAGTAALEGDWYGYWVMNDAGGEWSSMEGYWWDCCAHSDGGDEPYLLLWDEDMPRDNYLALIRFEKTGEGYRCTGGDFLDIPIAPEAAGLKLENEGGALLKISGSFEDADSGCFYYSFYMRPWGELWPDNKPRPYYYESWYLPKIEAAKPIPDEILIK